MYGMRRGLKRMNIDMSHGRGFYLAIGINLLGTVSASAINCLSMRWKELKGVRVFDTEHNDLGMSELAGREVLKSMVVSRATLSSLGVGFPLAVGLMLSRFGVYQRHRLLFDTVSAVYLLSIVLPMSVAVYDKQLKIHGDRLEDSFHN